MQCLDSVPHHHLNFIELIQHQWVSHMMRIGNNRHRPYYLCMESRVMTLLRLRVFYLPMVELGHIPCRHIVKEYRGFLCSLKSSQLEQLPKHTHLVLDFVLIEYFNKGVHEEVPYLVYNPITLHLTEDCPLRLPTIVKRIAQ